MISSRASLSMQKMTDEKGETVRYLSSNTLWFILHTVYIHILKTIPLWNSILAMTYHVQGNTSRLHAFMCFSLLIWHGQRAYVNVNKCFSGILNGVRSRNSQRRRKDGWGKEKKSDRKMKNRERKRGKACMCPCACSLVQKRHCHYQSLSAALKSRGVIRQQGRESVVPPRRLHKHHTRCLSNHTTTLMSNAHPLMLSRDPECSSATRWPAHS